jgi:hypothetical protein
MLEQRAQRLGVAESIIFHDRFVSHAELVEFLAAADIYITPYLKEEQISSGTLAYAVGCGKAVISTHYRYARELLDAGRGIIVPWRDATAVATEVVGLLQNDEARLAMQARAALHGRGMVWPVVARQYVQSFERARTEQRSRLHTAFQAKTLARRPTELPEINLSHLQMMTDDTGLLQHARFGVPRYSEGYCTDDNARALLLTTLLEDVGTVAPKTLRRMASRYMAFIGHAFNAERGRFRNFMSYGRAWIEETGSEDSHGRALWALGTVVGRSSDPGRQSLGGDLFHAALVRVLEFTSPRAWAYVLLGIDEYLRAFQGDNRVEAVRAVLTGRLMDMRKRAKHDNWPWFEESLTYCNARLAQALLVSGARMGDAEMTEAGLGALDWLLVLQTSADGYFAPIGSNNAFVRGGPKTDFDQQPVEVCATISACIDARRITGKQRFLDAARMQFNWFLGHNQLERPVYDASTGGCRDGLHHDRVNQNQGAESTLSFLMALSELRLAVSAHTKATPFRELPRELAIANGSPA